MPVFNPAIPQPTDQLSVSQGDLLANFGTLGPIAGNAFPASTSIFQGSGSLDASGFNWIYLPAGTSGTPPSGSGFAAGQIALYSQSNTATSLNELYVNKTVNQPSADTIVQIPITAFNNGTITSSQAAAWTYLPSGMLMIGGLAPASPTSGSTTITFNSGPFGVATFPGFKSFIMTIQATRLDPTTASFSANVNTFSLTGCSISVSNMSSGQFFWFAIGY